MIWVVRQFVTHQTLEIGLEQVRFPIRVEVEFRKEGIRVYPGSICKKVLYNKTFLLKRYPDLKEEDLDIFVEKRVQEAIQNHLTIPEETE